MKKIFIAFIIFFTQFNHVTANTKIVFIDIEKIISTSKPGIYIIKQLNDLNNKNSNIFKNDATKLKTKENKLIAQKNILSETDFQSKANQLKIEIKDYNENRIKIINDLKKLKIDNTNKLLKLINPILLNYSNEKSISIILQKKDLIIGKSELDITDEIIRIINKDIDKFEIK